MRTQTCARLFLWRGALRIVSTGTPHSGVALDVLWQKRFTPWVGMKPLAALTAGMFLAAAPVQSEPEAPLPERFAPSPDTTEQGGSPQEGEVTAPVDPETLDPPAELPPEPESGGKWGATSSAERSAPPVASPSIPPAPTSTSPRPGSPTQSTGLNRPPQDFNRISVYGAPTLGTLNRALGVYLGFPLLGARVVIGASPAVDVGLGFDSFYGSMNELRLFGKHLLGDGRFWTIALVVEGGAAIFAQRPEVEGHGPRWVTGRRNFNAEGGAILSYRGASVQSARLFLDTRYQLAIDTQPYAQTPLGGVPPPVELGHNFPIRMGAEMPFSPRASFLFVFGFEIHGRTLDSRFMPVVAVGLVTGL